MSLYPVVYLSNYIEECLSLKIPLGVYTCVSHTCSMTVIIAGDKEKQATLVTISNTHKPLSVPGVGVGNADREELVSWLLSWSPSVTGMADMALCQALLT